MGRGSGRRVGWFLLGWLALVVGAIVLAPFAFEPARLASARWESLGSTEPRDVVLNVVLFLPLGFLLERVKGGSWRPLTIAVLGALAATGIECAQLLLPGRYSALSDILANGVGSGLGAMGSAVVRRRMGGGGALVSRFFLDLPLVALVWMLVPLAWLLAMDGLRTGVRAWLLLPVAAAAGTALAAAGRSGAASLPARTAPPLFRSGVAWWAVAFLPALAIEPLWAVGTAPVFGGGLVMGDLFWRRKVRKDRRVEPLAVAMVLLLLSPWYLVTSPGMGSLGWNADGESTRALTLALVQLVVGYATLGFAVAEWLGRSAKGVWAGSLAAIACAATLVGTWGDATSPARWMLLGGAALAGSILYRQQRADILALLQAERNTVTDADE